MTHRRTRFEVRERHEGRRAFRVAASLGLLFACALVLLGPAGWCEAAVGQWTQHVNSSDLSWVHFDGSSVWCASTGGALKFDPATAQFQKIVRDGPGTLVSNLVSCVAVSDGHLSWFGTRGFGLSLLNQGQWILFTEGITQLPSNTILSLGSSGNSLWAGTTAGLALFEGATLTAIFDFAGTAGGIPNDVINDVTAGADTVWCATQGGVGRGVRVAGSWTWQAVNSGLASLNVLSVGRLGGRVWVGTQDDVFTYSTYEFNGGAWVKMGNSIFWAPTGFQERAGDLCAIGDSAVFVWTAPNWVRVSPPSTIQAQFRRAASDGTGKLWCATSKGLVSFNGADWEQFTPQGPQFNYAEGLSVGVDGNAWAAIRTQPAALKYDGNEWKLYDNSTTSGGLQFTTLFSVLSSRSGTVWFGHCCHITCRADRLDFVDGSEVWSNYYFNNAKNIREDQPGIVWFSSEGNGIYAFDPATSSQRQFTASVGGLASNDVESVVPLDSRRRWVGHLLAGLDYWDDRGTADASDDFWKHFSTSDGLLSMSVTSAVAAGNKVYVGSQKGVSVFQDTVWVRNYGAADLASVSATVNDVAADPFGNVWVGTDGGVAKIASGGGIEATYTFASSGLIDNEVHSVAVDSSKGEVWFGTPNGMAVLQAWNPAQGRNLARAYVYPNPFRPSSGDQEIRVDGLPTSVRASVHDVSGRLIKNFGTVSNGETIWDGTDLDNRAVPTGLYLLRLTAGNSSAVKKIAVIR